MRQQTEIQRPTFMPNLNRRQRLWYIPCTCGSHSLSINSCQARSYPKLAWRSIVTISNHAPKSPVRNITSIQYSDRGKGRPPEDPTIAPIRLIVAMAPPALPPTRDREKRFRESTSHSHVSSTLFLSFSVNSSDILSPCIQTADRRGMGVDAPRAAGVAPARTGTGRAPAVPPPGSRAGHREPGGPWSPSAAPAARSCSRRGRTLFSTASRSSAAAAAPSIT